ncbi:hypothetical protein ASPCADRAFT_505081 [Aspergillus carbonarius ITEM 5010]|uniref:FAD/NAD(P)-binding domain-containing protein n=1 Tax=Aspergillus carbonarius (strain ITEM 5010) TaxID=602072 RepID=A0A1R3RUA0_ASPC5|nr:hypothetical protein ASPCADRAFT_505081 [Aspergillus carbonarius ITEM 5010]
MSPSHKHNITLPTAKFPESPPETSALPPQTIAHDWIVKLQTELTQSHPNFSTLLHGDSWWRDMLAFSWDFHTLRGRDKIEAYIAQHQPHAQITGLCLHPDPAPAVESPQEGLTWVRAVFGFQTSCGAGLGVVYLTWQDDEGCHAWKAYAVYTALQGLKGLDDEVEDFAGSRMPGGIQANDMPGGIKVKEQEPTVMVLGAGQSGLNVSARLQRMGTPSVVVEQNGRVGDNWRHRYRSLVLHDHVDTTHLAYLPFPPDWPVYSSKDELADWLEVYAKTLSLNIWLNTTVKSAVYDDTTSRWSVTVVRHHNHLSQEQTLRPSHIVWSAGQFGAAQIPDIPNRSLFQGTIYHSSAHQDASLLTPTQKKVVIIGTGNSGHDIAQDFYENGANVTLLQRSGTYVLGQAGIPLLPENASIGSTIPLDTRDLLSESLPWPVALALCRQNTTDITSADHALLSGLEQAGFRIHYGPHDQGIMGLYIHRGGGYYIDFGCSQLIIDGKIAVRQCTDMTGFDERHLLLGDGSRLEADIVVFATGYLGPLESVRRVLGEEVAGRCHQALWGLDSEGEIRTVWRSSGHPGFWFMGGNLAQARVYSRFVALQIAAVEAGLVVPLVK